MQTALEASKQRVIAMMDRISNRDEQSGVAMFEIGKELVRYIIKRVESLKLHFEGAIKIVDGLFGIDFKQIAKADVRFDIDSHGAGESADRILYDRAIIQKPPRGCYDGLPIRN